MTRHVSLSPTAQGFPRHRGTAVDGGAVSDCTPGLRFPKTVNGRTRAEDKARRDSAKERAEDICYAKVDARDGLRCRVTGKRLSKQGGLTTRVERHHIISRGAGGPHETWNVVTLSPVVHDEIEHKGTLRVSGNADLTDDHGRHCGVKVEKLINDIWKVTGWV